MATIKDNSSSLLFDLFALDPELLIGSAPAGSTEELSIQYYQVVVNLGDNTLCNHESIMFSGCIFLTATVKAQVVGVSAAVVPGSQHTL